MVVSYSEFKGNPLIELKRSEEDEYPFRFGVKKAQLIIEHLEEIKQFVEQNSDSE